MKATCGTRAAEFLRNKRKVVQKHPVKTTRFTGGFDWENAVKIFTVSKESIANCISQCLIP